MHILLFFALLSQSPVPAATGRLVEKVACPSDPTQTYTLYLPSAYTTERRWPLLLVFDPRGRGTFAADIFREAAERFGWIIASSDNTQSDGPWEPNARALAAMWPDVLRTYAVDPKRIYAAGFSGGASVAWALGRETGAIAGVIASGAPNPGTESPKPVRAAWFGSAGRADFNFLDAKAIDARIAAAANPHRLEYFDGGHQWLPRPVAMRAVGWLEVLAMKDGLRPRHPALASTLLDADMAAAASLETSGDIVGAHRAYSSIVESYDTVTDAAVARARIAALAAGDTLTRAKREEERADERERARKGDVGAGLVRFMTGDIDTLPELLGALHINSYVKAAQGTGYEAQSIRRTLEQVYVQVSFYVWREFEEKRDYRRAALSLEAAVAIHPERPLLWVNLAADRVRSGSKGSAMAALRRAVEEGYRDAGALETDPRFLALQKSPEFISLVQKLKGSSHQPVE
jgi:dienelactone hydrolase